MYTGHHANCWTCVILLDLYSNTERFMVGKLRFQVPCLRPQSQQVAAGISLKSQGHWKVWAVCALHKGAQGRKNTGLKYSSEWWMLAPSCYSEKKTNFCNFSRTTVCTEGIPRPLGGGMIPWQKKICSERPRSISFPARYFLPDCPPPMSPLK